MKNYKNPGTGTPESRLLTTIKNLQNVCDSVREVQFFLDIEENGDFRFSFANSAFLRKTGLDGSQVIGKYASEVMPGSYLELILPNYRRAISEKKSVQWEETNTSFAQQQIMDITISPVFGEDGTCTTLICTAYDITERKRTEAALLETQVKYKALLEAVPEGVVVVDADGHITEANQVFSEMTGHEYSKLIGGEISWFIPADLISKPEKHEESYRVQPTTRELNWRSKCSMQIKS